jgi:hypothetical protein
MVARAWLPARILQDAIALRQRRVDKGIFSPEEDLDEAIRTARYDSFTMGPEMASRHRLAKLRQKEYAAKKATARRLLRPKKPLFDC